MTLRWIMFEHSATPKSVTLAVHLAGVGLDGVTTSPLCESVVVKAVAMKSEPAGFLLTCATCLARAEGLWLNS